MKENFETEALDYLNKEADEQDTEAEMSEQFKIKASDDDDDDRVINDMSALKYVAGASVYENDDLDARTPKKSGNQASVDIDRTGVFAAMKGALLATFSLYLVYAVIFGIFIFLLTRIIH